MLLAFYVRWYFEVSAVLWVADTLVAFVAIPNRGWKHSCPDIAIKAMFRHCVISLVKRVNVSRSFSSCSFIHLFLHSSNVYQLHTLQQFGDTTKLNRNETFVIMELTSLKINILINKMSTIMTINEIQHIEKSRQNIILVKKMKVF